jgi:gas vesicle protein
MAKPGESENTVIIAFLAGAVIAAGVTLLITPRTGREIREKLGGFTDEAVHKLREAAREARFKVSPKTGEDAFRYDGGGCWV